MHPGQRILAILPQHPVRCEGCVDACHPAGLRWPTHAQWLSLGSTIKRSAST